MIDSFTMLEIYRACRTGDSQKLGFIISQLGIMCVLVKDEYGYTPLHIATDGQHHDIVRMLIENGAEVNAQDREGMTALHHAVLREDIVLAEMLLLGGADQSIRDNYGLVAIDKTSTFGIRECFEELFSRF